jgi:hypothetical protein
MASDTPLADRNAEKMPPGTEVLKIQRRNVMRADISPITEEMDALIARQSRGGALTHKVYFDLQGFQGDDRYLREIPEVRKWFQRLEQRYPFLLYLLSGYRGQLQEVAAMFVPYEIEGANIVFEQEPMGRYLKEKLGKSVSYARAIGADPQVSIMLILSQLSPGQSPTSYI